MKNLRLVAYPIYEVSYIMCHVHNFVQCRGLVDETPTGYPVESILFGNVRAEARKLKMCASRLMVFIDVKSTVDSPLTVFKISDCLYTFSD